MKYGRKIQNWTHLYGYQIINDKKKCNYYGINEYNVCYIREGKKKNILSLKYEKETENYFVAKKYKAC